MILFLALLTILLVAAGTPIAFAMGASTIASMIIFLGHLPGEIVAQRIVNAVDKFPLVAVPLFILAGELMNTGGLTDRLVNLCRALFGWIKGGLGYVTVATAIFLSGISGSGTADAAALSKTLIPSMRKQGYDDTFSTSLVAASATLGPIIPPSIVMIIYASMTSISIGKLFIAGVIPGLLMGAAFMLIVFVMARLKDYPRDEWRGFGNLLRAGVAAAGPLVAPVLLVVGLFGGYFTATELGAIVVAYAIALGFLYGEMSWARVFKACCDTALSTGVILFVIAVASLLGWILAVGRLPQDIGALLASMGDQRVLIILVIIAILLALGCVLDGVAIMVILVPIFMPVATAIGMDPVQFAMVIILCIVAGGITPPVGIILYICCQVGGVPFRQVTGMIWWFVLALVLVTVACAFIPALTLALPEAMIGS
jgi:tripartite ATP-independent transporter DctM subunit